MDTRWRALGIQIGGTAAFAGVLGYGGWTAWDRLRSQGIAYGFDVLFRATSWQIGSPFLSQTLTDPYWWTLLVAVVNTLAVGLIGIGLAAVFGLAVGLGLVAPNRAVARLCRVYVEVFRNVPLVLQCVFWYATFTRLPRPGPATPGIEGWLALTNRGVFAAVPQPVPGRGAEAAVFAAVLLMGLVATLRTLPGGWRAAPRAALAAAGASATLAGWVALAGLPWALSRPVRDGFSFRGGIEAPVEFLALTFAIVVFSAAYVAEIVRGGLQSVPRGQIEAARALGLRPGAVFLTVRLPIGLRSMIPPFGNQAIFIMKATAVGLAVAYSDLFAASVVSISQTGQAIEFLVVMMAAYVVINYAIASLINGVNRSLAFKGRA